MGPPFVLDGGDYDVVFVGSGWGFGGVEFGDVFSGVVVVSGGFVIVFVGEVVGGLSGFGLGRGF